MNMDYAEFFEEATAHEPFPYQLRLGEEPFPKLLDIPTGLGKTAAVVVAWLYRRMTQPESTPRRLVYCLPMRTLVEQSHEEIEAWLGRLAGLFDKEGVTLPTVHLLMGGDQQLGWAERPEDPSIVVGTQDMLLSRALMRGYGMSRYAWPMHFALLHSDAYWVFDETQLMGVAVETSAQLQAFREQLGTAKPADSLWMSATLGDDQLDTVDHKIPDDGLKRLELSDADRNHPRVRQRISATKRFHQTSAVVPKSESKENITNYAQSLAEEVLGAHIQDTLTLVIVNRVDRAQQIYEQVLDCDGRTEANTALIHSRFRRPDRAEHERILKSEGDRIVVATQAIEAGVDVSSRTMFTELAPWPSLVQRFGRCNRYGDFTQGADVYWVDIEYKKESDGCLLPYELDDIEQAKEILADIDDVGPAAVGKIDYASPLQIRPVLRRKDLIDLFDTTPDLAGNDIDVSRYIRDGEDKDVLVYWRDFEEGEPSSDESKPSRSEICRVSWTAANKFLGKKKVSGWRWDALDGAWIEVDRAFPGQTILLDANLGGYDPKFGWTGDKSKKNESVLPGDRSGKETPEDNDGDWTDVGDWVSLTDHLRHVEEHARQITRALNVPEDTAAAVERAARWHDVGKSHKAFQSMLVTPAKNDDDLAEPPGNEIWAKSNHQRGKPSRKYFRHELASAMAFLDHISDADDENLVVYLIAAHHGKVRLSIRSLPNEAEPDWANDPDRAHDAGLFARGVWHGDRLSAIEVPGEGRVGPFKLSLKPMRLGEGSWLQRMISLRDNPDLGPFRLAWLETLVRLADHRASAAERKRPAENAHNEPEFEGDTQ